jgi:hypothetical protein
MRILAIVTRDSMDGGARGANQRMLECDINRIDSSRGDGERMLEIARDLRGLLRRCRPPAGSGGEFPLLPLERHHHPGTGGGGMTLEHCAIRWWSIRRSPRQVPSGGCDRH